MGMSSLESKQFSEFSKCFVTFHYVELWDQVQVASNKKSAIHATLVVSHLLICVISCPLLLDFKLGLSQMHTHPLT